MYQLLGLSSRSIGGVLLRSSLLQHLTQFSIINVKTLVVVLQNLFIFVDFV